MKFLKAAVEKTFNCLGYGIVPIAQARDEFDPYMEPEFKEICSSIPDPIKGKQTVARQYAVFQAVQYAIRNKIPGDFVECGVFRGAMPMIMAYTLRRLGEMRTIYLYDTYEGMTQADDRDTNARGIPAERIMKERGIQNYGDWCLASLDEVQENLRTTGYPMENFRFVKGDVQKTLPHTAPEKISLLRLDTDWYASTYHEMAHLFPRLSPNGVLLLDDYGNWVGSGKAVDQYFKENGINMLLARTDAAGRLGIRTS